MFFIKDNQLKIFLLGIKLSIRINNFFKNEVYLIDSKGKQKRIYHSPRNLKIRFLGENAKIFLPKGKFFKNSKLICGTNSFVKIDTPHNWGLNDLFMEVHHRSSLHIKENCCIKGGFITACGSGIKIQIGSDCMFSDGIIIRTHDGHTIYDKTTKQPVNMPKDVIIGDHCWLAKNVSIFKGVKITKNVIIGANSIVTKNIEQENSLVVGNPAKVVKTNVDWDRRFNDYFINNFQGGE